MSHTTIASMFGPKKALLGNSKDSVSHASDFMRKEQAYVLKCGTISVTMLFLGGIFQAWDNLVFPLACTVSFCFIYGFYILFESTYETYVNFLEVETTRDEEEDNLSSLKRDLSDYASIRSEISNLSDLGEE